MKHLNIIIAVIAISTIAAKRYFDWPQWVTSYTLVVWLGLIAIIYYVQNRADVGELKFPAKYRFPRNIEPYNKKLLVGGMTLALSFCLVSFGSGGIALIGFLGAFWGIRYIWNGAKELTKEMEERGPWQ